MIEIGGRRLPSTRRINHLSLRHNVVLDRITFSRTYPRHSAAVVCVRLGREFLIIRWSLEARLRLTVRSYLRSVHLIERSGLRIDDVGLSAHITSANIATAPLEGRVVADIHIRLLVR